MDRLHPIVSDAPGADILAQCGFTARWFADMARIHLKTAKSLREDGFTRSAQLHLNFACSFGRDAVAVRRLATGVA